MKKSTATRINATVWFLVAVALMSGAYRVWSAWGAYTFGSFCASAVVHGGPCALFGFLVHEKICSYFDKQNREKR